MGDPIKSSPSSGNIKSKKPASKNGEKLAVRQDLPVENLLEDFLRQQLAPDPNDGNNYYVGQVVKVIENKKSNIDIFNIFDDSISNLERFYSNNKTQDKSVTKQILVHIPELYSSPIIPETDDLLNYYTKFKINYSKSDSINVKDYVKIVFKDTKNFTEPEIIAIYRSSDESEALEYQIKGKLSTAFNESINCRIAQIGGSQGTTANADRSFSSSPSAGYYELFKELNYLLSNSSRNTFKLSQGPFSDNEYKNISNMGYDIYAYGDAKKIALEYNEIKNKVKEGTENLEISSWQVLLRIKLPSKDKNILEKFADYISSILDNKLKFLVIKEPYDSDNESIDIKIDIQVISDFSQISLENYYKKSVEIKDGKMSSNPSEVTSSQQSSDIITINSTFASCNNNIPSINELYISTIPIGGNAQQIKKWVRKDFDSAYVNYFLNNPRTTSLPVNYKISVTTSLDLLKKENLFISGELVKKKKSNPFYDIVDYQKNNFYKIPTKIQKLNESRQKEGKKPIMINSSFDKRQQNFADYYAIEDRIGKISNFLNYLHFYISSQEKVIPEKLLIIPINVIRFKSSNEAGESRHLYGQAVDFTVYVDFSKTGDANPSIFQIPPEIVYLYCLKAVSGNPSFPKENCGHGIFTEEGYNHFEILSLFEFGDEQDPSSIKKGLTKDELQNGRLWISAPKDSELKNLNSKSIAQREDAIKEYVKKNYLDTVTGLAATKFSGLVI